MTLTHGADRLETPRLVLRQVSPDDLPFFTRLHALPEVAQALYPEGRPRTPEEVATWLRRTLAGYEEFSLGHLAVQRPRQATDAQNAHPIPVDRAPVRTFRRVVALSIYLICIND